MFINHRSLQQLRKFPLLSHIALVIFLLEFFSFAQVKATPARLDSLILAGKERIYELRFPAAEQTFVAAQKAFPDHPHGYVLQTYLAALMYGLDQGNAPLAEKLERQIERAKEVCEAFIERYPDSPDSYFYMALTKSIEALYHVINRSFVKGYFSGRSSKNLLERVVKMDPVYSDAYLGLGMFHYYADLLPGLLKFIAGILGFEGDRVRGRNEVYMAAARGHYFRVEGEFIYHTIGYFLEGEKERAIRALKLLYARYPTNQGLGLILAYHYRRTGYIQKCIDYCERFSDEHSEVLPQITNLRYYNLAASYYDLNQFQKADSLTRLLDEMPTRKSPYYQAAINYYRGHLADLQFDRETAMSFFDKITKDKQMLYWYWRSRMHVQFPMDSLQFRYFVALNDLGSRQFGRSLAAARALQAELAAGKKSVNSYLPLLVGDLLARNLYIQRQFTPARTVYESILPAVEKMDDDYRRSWIFIHYGRLLREMKAYAEAKKYFEKAHKLDDDFTRLIVEREKFLTEKKIQTAQETGED